MYVQNAVAPDWSGKFYLMDGQGYIPVHIDDHQTHRPPEGWVWAGLEESEAGDYEIHRYAPREASR